MAISDKELLEIEEAKRRSVPQLLFRAARIFNELGVAKVQAATGQNFRHSHTKLFPHIDFEGTRLTELARRLEVSKQAAGQLVSELEEMGALERVPDPNDGRAKLIRFSKEGRAGILRGLGLLQELEDEFVHEIGQEAMDQLREGLQRLVPALEARQSRDS